MQQEVDGDLHIHVQLDPAYTHFLQPANQQWCAKGVCGLLVVEAICVEPITNKPDAVPVCHANPDRLQTLPSEGQHVWLEGRYVFDENHNEWAELHPLYKWGLE